jgi:glutamine amidotransferase
MVAIVKYNAGNTQSVSFALQRLGVDPLITDDPEELMKADKVIFPGVGEASTAMNYLRQKGLDKLIPTLKQPVFGVCLGLQLLCKHSDENNTECLGVFPVNVKKFPPLEKVPHMGWNNAFEMQGRLFEGVPENPYLYYVHSYYAELSEFTIAKTEYILPFSAALQKDNFYALQAHPEKSSLEGSKILENFLKL